MITALLYLWFAVHGQLPFEPWWVVGLLFADCFAWATFGKIVVGVMENV